MQLNNIERITNCAFRKNAINIFLDIIVQHEERIANNQRKNREYL